MNDFHETLSWKISVPIFKNTVILKQIGIAIGIPFGLVILIIAITSGKSVYALYAIGLIVALLFLTWVFIMVIYRGKYDAEFVLDKKGILYRTQEKQAKKNGILNVITVVLGLASGKPSVAGAGMLAQSNQEVFIRWAHITKIKYKPQNHTILLRGKLTENIGLFCTKENYSLAENFIKIKTKF
ncbi:MAG: hypothetical protein VB120_06145 [Lachnospiraceae bacterium]|nr:hypothetical protein [Lachnospiraceae bacterium]